MVNWTQFEQLPGSADYNFESLCRALINRHYGKCGQFDALANQPGVEFHLHLFDKCALGDRGRWFGWQCRWYSISSGSALGNTRRKKIEDAIAKSTKALPNLTDWVLWTRNPLTKGDQTWFHGLKKTFKSKMKFHLWTSSDVEELLTGDAEIFRKTYFGELVFTPNLLADLHKSSVAPIHDRWLREAHQIVHAERSVRRMLGEAESWNELTDVARRLLGVVAKIDKEPLAASGILSSLTPVFVADARKLADMMQEVHDLLAAGDMELLCRTLNARPKTISKASESAPRKMRGACLACGLTATNGLADLRLGIQLLDEVDSYLATRMVSIVADAGGGKTQMAAELTAPKKERPAGIFLRGSELHSGRTLDVLAQVIKIQGVPVPSMEALVAALDAAGRRSKRKLPLVIDGLNEAQYPKDWKPALTQLLTILECFPNVLVVCTVRPGDRKPGGGTWDYQGFDEMPTRLDFAEQALPDNILNVTIPGFGEDTTGAIDKYFQHFRINRGDAEIPLELLSHPLTLRIFCEVTNRERKKEVGIESIPGSLAALFEKYVERAIKQIALLSPREHPYYEHDVRKAISDIGTALWNNKTRELPSDLLETAFGDNARPWDKKMLYLFEQEGLILLVPGESPMDKNIIPVYDALGGYFIANSLLMLHGKSTLETWLNEKATLDAFAGDYNQLHPLKTDIFQSLVTLLPRRHNHQLWQLLGSRLKMAALHMTVLLESNFIDNDTVSALSNSVSESKPNAARLFRRFYYTRSSPVHPLNADFLDRVLRLMPVGNRDILWTEWVRRNGVANYSYDRELDIVGDIETLKRNWEQSTIARTEADRLRATWLMWLLPTTVRNLRDRATRAIYWFGRGDPASLFKITEQAADINDPYVFERMLAASYGVSMACHCDPNTPKFGKTTLADFAKKLFGLLFQVDAPYRTTHVLTREYAGRIIELAILHNRKLFSKAEIACTRPPFYDGGRIAWQSVQADESDVRETDSPFRTDFENYTLGRLVEGRGNYDFKHADYRRVRAQVLWRVKQLGWTPEKFQPIDRAISSDRHSYSRTADEHHKVDRYGKKYSWIAYFEVAGWLRDQGLLKDREDNGRTRDVDIDPSFPSPTPEAQLITTDFLGDAKLSPADWIKKGPTPNIEPFIRQASIRDEVGPWIALDGFVTQQDEAKGRRLFAFVRTFFVAKNDANAFTAALTKQHLGGRWLPEKPSTNHAFSGEIPWCSAFPKSEPVDLRFVVKERVIKVRRKQNVLFFDGKQVSQSQIDALRAIIRKMPREESLAQAPTSQPTPKRLIWRDAMVDVDEVKQEFRKFRAMIPVHDFGWSGRNVDNIPAHGITLTKQFAQSSGLVHLPQTHDLQTKDHVRVTQGIQFRRHDFNNSEEFFFIREDTLRAYLKKHDLTMVWAVWGERELSYKQMERARPDGDLAGLSHGDFQTVIRFK